VLDCNPAYILGTQIAGSSIRGRLKVLAMASFAKMPNTGEILPNGSVLIVENRQAGPFPFSQSTQNETYAAGKQYRMRFDF
jgi:hypothetical protein